MPDSPDWIDAFDKARLATGVEILRREGFEPAPPGTIGDAQIRGCLWELLYALAARRIFLTGTDHLSNRELYTWLVTEWLPRETRDLPPEAEWNCTVDPIGSGSEEDNLSWLRYYAEAEARARWAEDFPEDLIPPHEDPPYDRDRWLPRAPAPAAAPADETTPDFEIDEVPDETPFESEMADPLGLADVDREIQIERMKSQPADFGGTPFYPGEAEEGLPAPEEALLEQMVDTREGAWERPLDRLRQQGVVLPPPDELTDETLGAKLWELLHELACRGFYLLHTNHLSDRELYTELWREDLREPAILPGRTPRGGWFNDFVGSGSAADSQLWLRYYASDEERTENARCWPNEPVPPREPPAHRRDWRLPKGPF